MKGTVNKGDNSIWRFPQIVFFLAKWTYARKAKLHNLSLLVFYCILSKFWSNCKRRIIPVIPCATIHVLSCSIVMTVHTEYCTGVVHGVWRRRYDKIRCTTIFTVKIILTSNPLFFRFSVHTCLRPKLAVARDTKECKQIVLELQSLSTVTNT